MQIVLFRHAERENSFGDDPNLSAYGKAQALRLRELLAQQKFSAPQKLWTSDKRRTRQTLEPASELIKVPIVSSDHLDERQNSETHQQFVRRIREFILLLENNQESAFVVSHFDWIAEALQHIHSNTDLGQQYGTSWEPGKFLEFQVENGIWKVLQQGVLRVE